ncbi:hypothetical protein [Paremcibacter congregatus]|uniref:hypothetical protein n=1 Tax=Paremcibacter congregatus TaxID=2043170 RepID=UPI003A938482
MKKKKTLIICRSFFPYAPTFGGAVRILKLCDFLLQQGFEVHVLAARGEFISTYGYDELLDKIKITYVEDKLQKYICLQELNKTAQKRIDVGKTHLINKVIGRMKKILSNFSTPDLGVFFINNYVCVAKKIINEHHIKNVIVSTPPHSDQLIGLKLKKHYKNKIKFIVDYRDSWNCSPIFSKSSFFLRKYSEAMEKKVISSADYFTCISEPMLTKLTKLYPSIINLNNKSSLIMNGFDEDQFSLLFDGQKVDDGIFRIGYFGSMSDEEGSYRNPTIFFEALEKIDLPIKVIIYGPVSINSKWLRRLESKLEVHPPVGHVEALRLMQDMDILMLLISKYDGVDEIMTGKFFDYVLVGRKVLSIGPKTMAVCNIIEKENIGYIAPFDNQKEIVSVLKRLVKYGVKTFDGKQYIKYSRQNQYNKFLEILD